MSLANKEVVLQFLDAYDRLDWDRWNELAHPDHVFHFPLAPEPLDRDGHRGLNLGFRQSFSQMEHVIGSMVEEESVVAVRGHVRITHDGDFQGMPPTGKTLEIGFMDFLRVEDGMVREEWVELDSAKLMSEVGG